MNQSVEIKQISAAIVAMQKMLIPAKKDSNNPFFKSKYADLSSCWEASSDALEVNGLAIVQLPAPSDPGYAALETIILHSSGEFISNIATCPLAKNDPQAYGATITYLRRYGMSAAIGLTTADDDAESAMHRPTDRTKPTVPPKTQPSMSQAGLSKPAVTTAPVLTILTGIERVTQAMKLDKTAEYTIHAGEKYFTSDIKLATIAKEVHNAGLTATLEYKDLPDGRHLVGIKANTPGEVA